MATCQLFARKPARQAGKLGWQAGLASWIEEKAMAVTRSPLDDLSTANASQGGGPSVGEGHLALVPTWLPFGLPADPTGSILFGEGDNSAGSGGDGIGIGVISSTPVAVFSPANAALALGGSSADAQQTNDALVNQHAVEMAGMGGNGGDGNVVIGGDTGTHAGSGGNGIFYGALVSSDVAVFDPVNTAVAVGPGSTATANQANNAALLQGGVQIAGVGGSGGDHNLAGGYGSGTGSLAFTGDNHAGDGGNGTFFGSLVDVNVAIYSPINIAIAGAGGSAHATQTNDVLFSQGATQIAGVGGDGGSFNMASDTIFTGGGTTGEGGDGHSVGSMVGVNVGYFEPVNIAMPAGGTAEAQQIDHVLYDQHSLQMGGVGGVGGDFNLVDGVHADLVHDMLAQA